MIIRVKKLKPEGHWKAWLDGKDHCGGMGDNPAEAIGFCVLNNTGYALNEAITEIKWLTKKPKGYS